MPYLQPIFYLPSGPLDIIGDVHGEHDALVRLLTSLGHINLKRGQTRSKRFIVFDGDICDRGPSSGKVIALVMRLVKEGRAICIKGNHELNIINNDHRDGNSWFFDYEEPAHYVMEKVDPAAKEAIYAFFSQLPVLAVRHDLRIAHACPHPRAEQALLNYQPCFDIAQWSAHLENALVYDPASPWSNPQLLEKLYAEQAIWEAHKDPEVRPPMLYTAAEYQVYLQNQHILRVLTSGMEEHISPENIFYVGGKWRFTQRSNWWNNPENLPSTPCVIGHYWRAAPVEHNPVANQLVLNTSRPDPAFDAPSPVSWFGHRNQVFCIDYSVGKTFQQRHRNTPLGHKTQLAALQWPEQRIHFDCGITTPTQNAPT